MALITISGEPGCRHEEAARIVAQRLAIELITEPRLRTMAEAEFGGAHPIPDRAWRHLVAGMVAHLAVEHHLVAVLPGAEMLFKDFPGWLRVRVTAPDAWRAGSLMVDRAVDRAAAKSLLLDLDRDYKNCLKRRFGRVQPPAHGLDMILSAATLEPDQIAAVVIAAAEARRLPELGTLPQATAAHIEFQARLELAKHGLTAPGQVKLKRPAFGHPSEQIFANLLDFYRIAWEYEPRSFPIQWDRDGRVLEAFTPDFYLPEYDMYVELTTMKQAHVTKKNRKVKLLKAMYPDVHIRVYYQKDIENLIFKHGIGERAAPAS